MRLNSVLLIIISLCLSISANAANIVVKHPNVDPQSARDYWPVQLLKMALSYDTANNYDTSPASEQEVNQERLKSMMKDGSLSVFWIGTSQEVEREFRPVRIPLFKGLLGHRIFIIRQGDQAKFSRVNSMSDLLQLQAGQGRFWSDTPILESAGIDVVKPVKYINLFHMLDGGRFDYFPRAVHEPWSEVNRDPKLSLTIESDLMLIYPMPLYFFTAADNVELASAIESGLRQSIADGTFDRMFLENPDIRSALEKTDVARRKVFRISNPSLSPETPLDEKALWFDIESVANL